MQRDTAASPPLPTAVGQAAAVPRLASPVLGSAARPDSATRTSVAARPGSAAARGARPAASQVPPPPRPSSPALHQQLPALPIGRPPSRLQHYPADGRLPAPWHQAEAAAGEGAGAQPRPATEQQAQAQAQAQGQSPPQARGLSAGRAVLRSKSMCVNSFGGASSAAAAAAATAAADAAALYAITSEARQQQQQQQQQQQAEAAAAQQAPQLKDRLARAAAGAELQAAAEGAAAWLAQQLSARAADLLHQLAAVLGISALGARAPAGDAAGHEPSAGCAAGSSGGEGGEGAAPAAAKAAAAAAAAAAGAPGAAPATAAAAAGQRPHQLFQQCSQLRGEKASLERLNGELSAQVRAHQGQLASLHLRLDNLLLERQRMQEEAAEAAAAVAALRRKLPRGQAQGEPGPALDTANAEGAPQRPSARASWQSEGGGSGRAVGELASEEVTWGRTLTGRAPAARPRNVPPVDLARLRPPPPPGGRQAGARA